MSSSINLRIKRLQREINQLKSKKSKAYKDEIDATKKINRALQRISRTNSTSTIHSKEREIKRENTKILKAKEKQTKLLKEITRKEEQLNKAINKQNQLHQKQQFDLLKQRSNIARQENMDYSASDKSYKKDKQYDVFISHATEDKDDFVNELARALEDADINIWYDSDSIGWGRSIRQEIDKGLKNSRYGIVVLSPTFIENYWTNYELDGILKKESSIGVQVILPIWHKVTADEINRYSPSLADKYALNTAYNTIDEIVKKVKDILNI